MSEPEDNSGSGFGYTEIIILVCIIGFIVWIAIPNFNHDGHNSPTLRCINNLRQIDGAINEWAMENGKTNGVIVTGNDIKPYLKLGPDGQLPKCPMGGKYVLGKIGVYPHVTCSLGTAVIPAHALP
jgi:hypothetical protein